MKTVTIATLTGGLATLTAISLTQCGIAAIMLIVVFLLGVVAGVFGIIYPLAKHRHLHMYYNDGKLVRDSMLRPQTGLHDMTNQLIQPGDVIMMMKDNQFLIISEGKNRKPI